MADPVVLTEVKNKAGLIRINRPKQRNALNGQVMADLIAAAEAFDADPAIGAVVLTGDEMAFAAGADIAEMAGATAISMATTKTSRMIHAALFETSDRRHAA